MNMNSKITKSLTIFALIAITLLPQEAHAAALFDSGTNFLTALQDLLTNTWARIWLTKLGRCSPIRNKRFWKSNSYMP